MNAKELRIGNLIKIENELYWPTLKDIPLMVNSISAISNVDIENKFSIGCEHINKITNAYYQNYHQFAEYIQPIPLTEEWLLKLNVDIEKVNNYIFIIDRFRLSWNKTYKFWYVMDKTSLCYITKVEYIHEWQNTYYVLNGTELTIK